MKITEVVAALICDGEKFLICRRPATKARGLMWEFVGGKVENGETKEAALARECREELDVEISVGDEFCAVIHEYPDLKICLTVFRAVIERGTPRLIEHVDMKWITPSETNDYDFCPADRAILEKIKGEK